MSIRFIVSDIDGTLLGPDHLLSASVKHAVKSYIQSGGLFTLATGRPWQTTQTLAKELGVMLPLILSNGAVVANGRAVMRRTELPLTPLVPLLMEANMNGLGVLIFYRDHIRALRRTKEIEQYERKENTRCETMQLANAGEDRIEKVILIGPMTVARELWDVWQPLLHGKVTVLQSEDNYLELVSANVNKGTALAYILKQLNISPHEVMAIGNQLNDLEMFRTARYGVAVANSHPELKKAASYICQRSYGDGVIEAIELLAAENMKEREGIR